MSPPLRAEATLPMQGAAPRDNRPADGPLALPTGTGPGDAHRRSPWTAPSVIIPALILFVLLLAAAWPSLLAPGDPTRIKPADAFESPSIQHLFGTDGSGRDTYTRVIHGARPAIFIGIIATTLGVGLAAVLGFLGALASGATDAVITRTLQVLFAFPSLVMALFLITILGPGSLTSAVAVGLATAPGYARIVRMQVLSVKHTGYVEAATVLGRSRWTVIRRHIVPNVWGALFTLVTLGLGQTIVWASSLSFLGLGTLPPASDWGSMLAEGREYIATAWWLTVFPGLFIVMTAGAATFLGRALNSATRKD